MHFPIMDESKQLADIPLALIAPHAQQAQRNHGQSLAQLAYRGGLSPSEALAVITDRDFPMAEALTMRKLGRYDEWNTKNVNQLKSMVEQLCHS